MSHNQTPSDYDIAAGAFATGFNTACTSLRVLGCYWWNLQMQILVKIGVMGLFKARWWLLLLLGFLLLAFVMPLGTAFAVSAFCALSKNPKAENNYMVELGQAATGVQSATNDHHDYKASTSLKIADRIQDLYCLAAPHHERFIKSSSVHVDDVAFAAAALGALDGTVQALGVKVSDLDMHNYGAAFIFKQLRELGRMDTVNPDWVAHITVEAMSSADLDNVRKKAGHFAYSAVNAAS